MNSESYYAVLFHKMIHWTENKKRLNRKELAEPHSYATVQYSIEELTAEIGACYLSSIAGIALPKLDNYVAYIQGWLKKLKDNRQFVV